MEQERIPACRECGRIILIDRAKHLFDDRLVPMFEQLDLKFIALTGTAGRPVLLLMKTYEPYHTHPETVLAYMEAYSLKKVMVSGGGKVSFSPHLISFFGTSKSFGSAHEATLRSIAQESWPGWKLSFAINGRDAGVQTYSAETMVSLTRK